MSKTDRASSALLGAAVVQRLLQELHQTPLTTRIGTHDVRFTAPGGEDAVVVLLILDPRRAGRTPATLDPLNGAVNSKLLEHQLDASTSKPGLSLKGRDGRRPAAAVGPQRREQAVDLCRFGDRCGREVVPHPGVGL